MLKPEHRKRIAFDLRIIAGNLQVSTNLEITEKIADDLDDLAADLRELIEQATPVATVLATQPSGLAEDAEEEDDELEDEDFGDEEWDDEEDDDEIEEPEPTKEEIDQKVTAQGE